MFIGSNHGGYFLEAAISFLQIYGPPDFRGHPRWIQDTIHCPSFLRITVLSLLRSVPIKLVYAFLKSNIHLFSGFRREQLRSMMKVCIPVVRYHRCVIFELILMFLYWEESYGGHSHWISHLPTEPQMRLSSTELLHLKCHNSERFFLCFSFLIGTVKSP